MDKILIVIPSYEDDLLIDTISSALNRAKYPDRLVFSIGLQYKNPPLIFEWFSMLKPYPKQEQFKIINYNVNDRPGLTRIMHDLCRLQTDEEYVLMINAHTEFVDNWDILLINDYKNLQIVKGKEKIALSGDNGSGVGIVEEKNRNAYKANFSDHPLLGLPSLLFEYKQEPLYVDDDYVLTHLATTIFFFANSKFIEQDVFDSVSGAGCIETNLAFYSYICGWDIYAPTRFNFIRHAGEKQWQNSSSKDGSVEVKPNNDPRYWIKITNPFTGEDMMDRIWSNSRSGFHALDSNYLVWVHLLYLDNKGILAKNKNLVERSAEDFFKAVGLHKGYLERVTNSYIFIQESTNKLFE